MNLQSYCATADPASLDESELAGLVPFLIGRPLGDEVAIVATIAGRPSMLRTIPLDRLDDKIECEMAAAFLTHSSIDGVWLIGHGTQNDDAAAAITELGAVLAQRGLCDRHRLIQLDPTRRNWRYAFEDDELDWGPIHRPGPLAGRLAALVFHTACIATLEAEAFAPHRNGRHADATGDVQARLARLRDRIGDDAEQAEADQRLLKEMLDADGPVLWAELVDLGVALDASPALARKALARIWASDDATGSGMRVWTEIARLTTGRVRATACALTALAAWRHGDPIAPIAAREALAADADSSLAQAVSAIVTSGALAANFEGSNDLAFIAERTPGLENAAGVA